MTPALTITDEREPHLRLVSGASGGSTELDRATLARCCAQEPEAFRAFVEQYKRVVFAVLSRIVGRGPHVDDLAQETFLRAYRAFPRFDASRETRASTWIVTIAVRLALDAKKARKPVSSSDQEPLSTLGNPEVERSRRELGQAIERAAMTLPEDQRAAFVLAEYHGCSMREIAVALDVPEATAKTKLFRARDKMRAELAQHWSVR